jgi:hypothetical protein
MLRRWVIIHEDLKDRIALNMQATQSLQNAGNCLRNDKSWHTRRLKSSAKPL